MVATTGLTLTVALATDFEVRIPLVRTQSGISNSGTNAVCLSYQMPTSRNTASELESDINAQVHNQDDAVAKVKRFNRAADTFETDSFVYESGESPADDFSLVPAEGYRIAVNDEIDDTANANDFHYELTGSYSTAQVTLYGPGDTLPAGEGTSASGSNHYCAPFHAASRMASDLRAEINNLDCPGGECNPSDDKCDGGANHDLSCARAFSSVSRLVIVSDTLQTYAGIAPSNDFVLRPSEAYLLKVTEQIAFTPEVLTIGEVTVDIVEHRPGGCGVVDGGVVTISNAGSGYDAKVAWDNATYNNLNNLVFLSRALGASANLAACPGVPVGRYCCSTPGQGSYLPGTCRPPPNEDPAECDAGDVLNESADICGCELVGTERVADSSPEACNNVHCGSSDTDCDSNTGNNAPEECTDPDKVFCNVLQDGYTFVVSAVSFDAGSTWRDNSTDLGLVPTVTTTNCCEAVCTEAKTTACTTDGDCTDGNGTCALGQGYCTGDGTTPCKSDSHCTGNGTCEVMLPPACRF